MMRTNPLNQEPNSGGDIAMRFCFFSARSLDNDFRLHLIDALKAKGHEVLHVRIGRINIVTETDGKRTEFSGVIGLLKLLRFLQTFVKASKPQSIFVDSTGAVVPVRSLLLRTLLRGLWCLDVFDDLLYDFHGLYRFRIWLGVTLLARLTPIKFVISPELLRHFPGAHFLENAAHTRWTNRVGSNLTDLVTLFSIDNRFDFTLIREIMTLAPQVHVYIYGRIVPKDPTTKLRLEELCAHYPNVIYRGEYRFNDIDTILAPFGIGFAPYISDNFLTEFISPHKYYLYLNSGMEVISTDIPNARYMHDRIHIAQSASDIIQVMARIRSDPSFRKNKDSSKDFRWEQRADEFIGVIQSHMSPSSQRLQQVLPSC